MEVMTSPSGAGAAIDIGATCTFFIAVPFSKSDPTMATLAPGLCDMACSAVPTNLCTHVNFLTEADAANYICQILVCTGSPTVTPTVGATAKEKVCPSSTTTTEETTTPEAPLTTEAPTTTTITTTTEESTTLTTEEVTTVTQEVSLPFVFHTIQASYALSYYC